MVSCYFFFQAEDGIRDLVRSRGLGDVYKRQGLSQTMARLAWVTSVTFSLDALYRFVASPNA